MHTEARMHKLGTEWWAIKNSDQYNQFNAGYIEANKLAKIDPESLKISRGDFFIHLQSKIRHTCRSVIKSGPGPARIFIPAEETRPYIKMGRPANGPQPPMWFTPDQVCKYSPGELIKVIIEGKLATII